MKTGITQEEDIYLQKYAPHRQFHRDLHPALIRSAFAGLYDGQCDEPGGERLLPFHARQLRGHDKDGLLPDRGSDR